MTTLPFDTDTNAPHPLQRTLINPCLWFEDCDGFRVFFCRHEVLSRVALSDQAHLKIIAVTLRQSRLATQQDIATTFGHSIATQRLWERLYTQLGSDAFTPKPHPGRPPSVPVAQPAFVRRWFLDHLSTAEIARRLQVDEATVRRLLRRLGLSRAPRSPASLPFPGAPESPQPPADVPPVAREPDQLLPASGEPRPFPADRDPLSLRATPSPADPPGREPDRPDPLPKESRPPQADRGLLPVPATPPGTVVPTATLATDASEPAVLGFSIDQNPLDRSGDRFLASQGLLEDAVPLFANVTDLPRLGVLLALPALAEHGGLNVFQRLYRTLGAAFYGLRTTVFTLMVLALLRIKRPEQLKEYSPQQLGRLLGLDRAPEVKTLRRKLTIMAGRSLTGALSEALVRLRLSQQADRVALLYLAGWACAGIHGSRTTGQGQESAAGGGDSGHDGYLGP